MATRVELVDDINGSHADETVTFALDNVTYEIDLSSANAEKIRKAFTPWIDHARRAGRKPTVVSSNGAKPKRAPAAKKGQRRAKKGPDSAAVRAWAESAGVEVSPRGRIPASVFEQYAAATKS